MQLSSAFASAGTEQHPAVAIGVGSHSHSLMFAIGVCAPKHGVPRQSCRRKVAQVQKSRAGRLRLCRFGDSRRVSFVIPGVSIVQSSVIGLEMANLVDDNSRDSCSSVRSE